MKALTIDNAPIMSVAGIDDEAVALRLSDTLVRLPHLLPTRCVREISAFGSTQSNRLRAREQLVMSEAAIAATGQFSRSLCEQQDRLGRLLGWFRPVGGELESLLRSLAWARTQGLRSVLLAQLELEASTRNGRPISPDVQLPVGSGGGGGGGGAELELVPIEPKDPDDASDAGGGGGGHGGDGGGAAPAVVVAAMPADSTGASADVDDDHDDADADDDDDDGLSFLDLDRKA